MKQKQLQFKLKTNISRVLMLSTLLFLVSNCTKQRYQNRVVTKDNEFWKLESYEYQGKASNDLRELEIQIDDEGTVKVTKFESTNNYYEKIENGIYYVNSNRVFKFPKKQFNGTLDSSLLILKYWEDEKKKGLFHTIRIPYSAYCFPKTDLEFTNEKLKSDKWVFKTSYIATSNINERFIFRKMR